MMVASLSVVGLIILIPLSYIAPAGAASQSAVWLGVSLLGLWVIPYLLLWPLCEDRALRCWPR